MSNFNDKALKSVADAVSKIMAETSHELKGNQHKIDANKNGKIDAHDFKLLRAKKGVKEEVEQLDEVGNTPAGRKALGSYVNKAIDDKSKDRSKGLRKATSRMYKDNFYGKKNEEVETTEEQLDEAFPTVADAKKRMDAGKTATGSVTKTSTGLVHKRDYKDDNDEDDMQKKSSGYGARQNFKRSTRVNESASFTEMLELYNEHGLKVLAPIETEEMDIDGTTVEVIDGDKINGYVETIVEEPDNEQFTKELKDQQASAAGKKPQPKVAAGRTMGVKTMPESVELDEEDAYNKDRYAVKNGKATKDNPTHMGSSNYKDQPHHVWATSPEHALKKKMKEEVELDERSLTSSEKSEMEKNVKGMKKGLSGFKQRYGERAKSVMYGAATNMAKKD